MVARAEGKVVVCLERRFSEKEEAETDIISRRKHSDKSLIYLLLSMVLDEKRRHFVQFRDQAIDQL